MAKQQWMKAEDTFVATLKDGSDKLVTKGQPFPDSHELVKRDQAASRDNPGRSPLFSPMEASEEEAPPEREAAAPQEPVKAPSAARAAGKAAARG